MTDISALFNQVAATGDIQNMTDIARQPFPVFRAAVRDTLSWHDTRTLHREAVTRQAENDARTRYILTRSNPALHRRTTLLLIN